MRKYSKILGAFSMSLASLLGFVEACHAQGSPVTAIDILLEPDATMVQHAQADNARLLKAYPDGFALDATHHPHITMLQQFVRTADLGKVYTAANRILANEKVTSWNLKAFKYYYIPVPPNGIAGIVVEPTENSTPAATGAIGCGCAFHGEDRNRCRIRERRRRSRHPTRIDRLRRQFHYGRIRQEVQSACHDRCRSRSLS